MMVQRRVPWLPLVVALITVSVAVTVELSSSDGEPNHPVRHLLGRRGSGGVLLVAALGTPTINTFSSGLSFPQGLCMNPAGTVLYVSTSSNAIASYTRNGNDFTTIAPTVNSNWVSVTNGNPENIACISNGYVLAPSGAPSTAIHAYDPSGTLQYTVSGMSKPTAVVEVGSTLYIVDNINNAIYTAPSTGSGTITATSWVSNVLGTGGGPLNIAYDQKYQRFYVIAYGGATLANVIARVSLAGVIDGSFSPTGLIAVGSDFFQGIAIDGAGTVLLQYNGNPTPSVYALNGVTQVASQWISGSSIPNGGRSLFIDRASNLWMGGNGVYVATGTGLVVQGMDYDGAIDGDPIFTGFLGSLARYPLPLPTKVKLAQYSQKFQVHGVPNHVYDLLSTKDLQVNARFIFLDKGICTPQMANFTQCWSRQFFPNWCQSSRQCCACRRGGQRKVALLKVMAGSVDAGLRVSLDTGASSDASFLPPGSKWRIHGGVASELDEGAFAAATAAFKSVATPLTAGASVPLFAEPDGYIVTADQDEVAAALASQATTAAASPPSSAGDSVSAPLRRRHQQDVYVDCTSAMELHVWTRDVHLQFRNSHQFLNWAVDLLQPNKFIQPASEAALDGETEEGEGETTEGPWLMHGVLGSTSKYRKYRNQWKWLPGHIEEYSCDGLFDTSDQHSLFNR